MPIAGCVVEGHAIVSADGMIADSKGEMPGGLRNEADWRYFQAALDAAALVVLGRKGHERHPNPGRRRLVLTRRVASIAPDPKDACATFWNPDGVPLVSVLRRIEVTDGVLAVTGGAECFGYFLPYFDTFVMAEVAGLVIPGGRPCFTGGQPKHVLGAAGLIPDDPVVIDPAAGVSQTFWRSARAR